MMTDEDIKRQYWVANNVGEIVKVSASLSMPLSKDKIASTLTQCSKQLAEDSLTLLARQLKLSRHNMFSWQQGLGIPCLESLLKLCDGLGITLCRFLTGTVDALKKHVSVKPIRRDMHRSTTKKELHQKLEAFLFEEPPLSIRDITARLGYRHEIYLYSRCPELCYAITAKYSQWHKSTPTIRSKRLKLLNKGEERKVLEEILNSNEYPLPSIREINRRIGYYFESRKLNHHFPDLCRVIIEKRREQLQNVSLKQELENILSEDIYPPPSLTEVAEKLGYTYDYLNHHFPTLCRAIVKRYRQLFDVDVLRKMLEASLADNSVPPPSMQEVARQVGFDKLRLYRQFPDICPKIVLRYQTYRKDQHNARMQNIHDEVENIILQLYAKGCYPSLKKVEKLLQDKLRRVEVGYFWHDIMQELALDGRESLHK